MNPVVTNQKFFNAKNETQFGKQMIENSVSIYVAQGLFSRRPDLMPLPGSRPSAA